MGRLLLKSNVWSAIFITYYHITVALADNVGCYSGVSELFRIINPILSQSWCISYCQDFNTLYAGLSYRVNPSIGSYAPYCTCFNSLNGALKNATDSCRVACPRDDVQFCGGYDLDLVFYIGAPSTTANGPTLSSITSSSSTEYEPTSAPSSTESTEDYHSTFKSTESTTESTILIHTTTLEDEFLTTSEMSPKTTDAISEDQGDLQIWYICVSILIVFIGSLCIVIWTIRNDGRRQRAPPSTKSLASPFPHAKNNFYHDSTEGDYSEIHETKAGDSFTATGGVPEDIYTEVSDETILTVEIKTHHPASPGVVYHTMHRLQSCAEEELIVPSTPKYASIDDEPVVIRVERPPSEHTTTGVNNEQTCVDVQLSPKYAKVRKQRPSSSQPDTITGVTNENTPSGDVTVKPSSNSYPSGSVNITAHECGGRTTSLYTHQEEAEEMEDVFMPPSSAASFSSGTIINVMYKTSSITRKSTRASESPVQNEH